MAFDRETQSESGVVTVNLRFKVGVQEIGPVENYLRAILAASGAELLEWNLYCPIICDQVHLVVEDPLYDPEGGGGYTVQS